MARNISPGACYQWHEELVQWLDTNRETLNKLLGARYVGFPNPAENPDATGYVAMLDDPMLDNYEHGDPFRLEFDTADGIGGIAEIRIEEACLQIKVWRHSVDGCPLPQAEPEADRLFHVLAALTVPDPDSDAYGRVCKQVSHALDAFDVRRFGEYGACMEKAHYESGDMAEGTARDKVQALLSEVEGAIHNDPRNVPDTDGGLI